MGFTAPRKSLAGAAYYRRSLSSIGQFRSGRVLWGRFLGRRWLRVVARETGVALVGKNVLAGLFAPGNEPDSAIVQDRRILELLRGEQSLAVRAQPEAFQHADVGRVV